MKHLGGKVAVVTGAASGIGRSLSAQLVAEGMSVILSDWNAEELENVRAALAASGGDVMACDTDVSNAASMQALADAAYAWRPQIDLLCNNAGVLGPQGEMLWTVDDADWDRVFAVNFRGPLNGIRAFLPRMMAADHEAHIVTTASMGSFSATPILPCYITSKHALLSLCETLRLQLKEAGSKVKTSVLCPGYTKTGLVAVGRGIGDEEAADDAFDEILARSAVPQVAMNPDDTAKIVVAAVKRGDFWIFPNAGSRDRIASRIDEILTTAP